MQTPIALEVATGIDELPEKTGSMVKKSVLFYEICFFHAWFFLDVGEQSLVSAERGSVSGVRTV
jgi:hypothetical protein